MFSNAIAPLASLYVIYTEMSVLQHGESPLWLSAFGAAGVVLGMWALAHRVIYTIGEHLTKITPTT